MWGVLPDVLDRACTYYADQAAIVDGERTLTYRELREWRNKIAHALIASGVQKGERVGLLMPNCLEFIPSQHGIWAAGAVLVQMPTRAAPDGFRANLAQTDATTLIYHAKFESAVAAIRAELPKLQTVIRMGTPEHVEVDALDFADVVERQPDTRPAVAIDEHDEAYVLFTSGSTGEPKGVVNSHFTWSYYSISAGLEIGDIAFGEVFAHGAPLTHFSQIFVMPTFIRGGTNVMLPGLEVEGLLPSIERHRITATALVPTIIYLLLDHPRRADFDLSSLRTVIYAGAPIAPERLREALEAFGPIFIQTYAGTEQGYVSCLRKNEHRIDDEKWTARLASAGRPMFAVQISIQDDQDRPLPAGQTGEICSRQLGQMLGYLDPARNAETVRDGWVHTGDIGHLDERGFLYIVDRKKDMVVSGGFNVFPRQVEDVLSGHPAVAQSAVIGVPHPKWGESVLAVVVARTGEITGPALETELINHVKAALGSVPAPKSVLFTDELPLNPAGKVDKKAIRKPYWQGRTRQIG
ncbi:long-chain fatty acid--CoA ligase [Mycobacterium sp. CVI_P3]|uniref:Long-chain fatty acid--CoA ligase n=1 Tax=Mycobacterium pinniadriaticum TaxID=2994102 RepID=A0ABT3SGW3_9MYCO|nr:long-chain fatty acid--CoA ligase [Mycobacterium pinniadriaticum]MCX2932383.1 long-chain fatty acid--CoA ligase [Mycobacterium pinniadriaticum]MCX2938760.1 long-chain fatty acid--CoA ligase [Mycobacterium pinniadriaticum]